MFTADALDALGRTEEAKALRERYGLTSSDDLREPISGRPHTQRRLALSSAPPVFPPTPMVWLDVLLYTGLRRGDAVQLGRQHVRDGVATVRTEKTGLTVSVPILPALAATLAAGPCGDLAFICGEGGKPLTKESFGNAFREACRAAGVAKSAHGVRKIGATRAAENGATVAELEAIFGWQGGGMASLYTRAADRARLAKGAIKKLGRP
jgi:integrase